MSMKSKINIITIISCVLVIFVFLAMFLIMPDKDFSPKENRTLESKPQFSKTELFSGEYTASLARYISDQFPLRDTLVAVKAYSELALGKGENNGIIYADGGTLIAKEKSAYNRLQENLQLVKEFEDSTGTNVVLAVLPRTVDVFSELLPDTYCKKIDSEIWRDYYETTNSLGLTAPNLYNKMCEGNNYYHTDHHYDIYGAYQAYALLGEKLGYIPKEMSFFTKKKVSDSFCGTSMRVSGFYIAPKDTITLLRYDGDMDYNITADGKQIKLYDFSRLDTTDQYAVFLGGNHARVDVSNSKNRQKLLIIRDSFADSIAPFLALHYDLIMVDLRYFTESVQQLVAEENIENVLLLESMSEFATAKNISYLKRGVSQ